VNAGFNGDPQFGTDPIRGRDQQRILESGGFQIKDPAKAADASIGAGPGGGTGQRFDGIDKPVSGVDIDARVAIGERAIASGLADGFLRGDPL